VHARRRVSLPVAKGQLVGLIGPNRSGKATLLNVMAGVARPTAATVSLDGMRLDRLPAHRIVERGIAKTHQIPKPFLGMTTQGNVTVAALYGARKARDLRAAADEARWVLRLVGLEAQADSRSEEHTSELQSRV